MGLLARLRRADGAVDLDALPPGAAPRAASSPPITASDIWGLPAWATLPPTPSLLAPMPLCVKRDFEDDLISWQPPERFLAPLAHAVSPTGPDGVVEGMAVISSEPLVEVSGAPEGAAHAEPELLLAIPPARALDLLPGAWSPAPAVASMDASRIGAPGTASTHKTAAPPTQTRSLVSAPPAPLPVLELRSGPLLSGGVRRASPSSPPPADKASVDPELAAGILGTRPPPQFDTHPPATLQQIDTPGGGDTTSPAMPHLSLPREAKPRSLDVPALARESSEAGERSAFANPHEQATREQAGTAEAVERPAAEAPEAPLVGSAPALPVASPARAGPGEGPLDVPRSEADETRTPGVPGPPPEAGQARPPGLSSRPSESLSPPTVQSLAPLPERRATSRAPRRSGLGQPMKGLPPTALSLDAVSVVQRGQMSQRLARSVSRGVMGSPGDGASSGSPPVPEPLAQSPLPPAEGAGGDGQAGRREWLSLPVVKLERLAAPATESSVAVVAPPDSERVAPLSSLRNLLPLLPAAPSRRPVAQQGRAEPAPTEGRAVREVIGRRHGVDLSEVPIDRSPAGAQNANQAHARAYTSSSGVVIPASVGSLDTGQGKALLAHELTHVAQRARLGPNVPPENTPAGRSLEAEARHAELAFAPVKPTAPRVAQPSGSPTPPPSLALQSVSSMPAGLAPLPGGAPGLRASTAPYPGVSSTPAAPSGAEPASEPATLPLSLPSRNGHAADAALAGVLAQLAELRSSVAAGSGTTTVYLPGNGAAPASPHPAPSAPAAPASIQRAPADTDVIPKGIAERIKMFEGSSVPSGSASRGAGVWTTRPDEEELSRLARWLYPLISYRLKGELREDRERLGKLTNHHYRKW